MPRHRQKGADTHKRDRAIVPVLAHICRMAEARDRQPYFQTISDFINRVGLDFVGGASHNAAVHRLYSKVLKYRRDPQPLEPAGGPPWLREAFAQWSRYELPPKK